MGITGLIQWVESATTPATIHQLQGKTVAIDSFWLLHKGSYSCSDKLVRGIKTTAMIDYALKYVKMLQSYCSNIIMVFDGRSLPAKKGTEDKRRENREKAKVKAHELFKSGRFDEARKEFSKAVVITHEYALELMEECRKLNVDSIVAMYEADGQLAYLNKIGLADYIVSEDSDLILFGCKKIVYKLTLDGKCTIFDSDKLDMVVQKYTFEKFRRICILSGCDYLNNLPGIGLSKAKKFMVMTAETDMRKAIPKIPSYLNLKITIPNDYIDNFLKAECTFKYMYVYDPIKRSMERLNEITDKEEEQYCVNAGELLKPEIAYQLALGNINPKTMQKISDYNPMKTLSRSIKTRCKYNPLFKIWNYSGKQEVTVKVKHQSKITFVPTKFKKSEVAKIAEEENKIEDGIEIDDLISTYTSEISNDCSNTTIKRPRSVLNEDLNTSFIITSPNNPFAKRQSLDNNSEKAENCSFIKSLATSSSYAESRVVSKFFSTKPKQEEDPLTIIKRIEASQVVEENKLEKKLELNKPFYSISNKFLKESHVNDDAGRNALDKFKEKYSNASNDIVFSQEINIDEPTNKSSNKNTNYKPPNRVIKSASTKNTKSKSTSLTLECQHKLSKFGFTKTNKIL